MIFCTEFFTEQQEENKCPRGKEVLKEKEEKVKILIRLRREICVRGK